MKLATLLAEIEDEALVSIENKSSKEIYFGNVKKAIETLKNEIMLGSIFFIIPEHTSRYNYLRIGIYI